MRISDWSSDVCSSDLSARTRPCSMRSLRSEMLIGRGKRKLPLARPKQRPESRTKKGLMLDTAMKGGARKLESERGRASEDRQSDVEGKSVSVRVEQGGGQLIKKKNKKRRGSGGY